MDKASHAAIKRAGFVGDRLDYDAIYGLYTDGLSYCSDADIRAALKVAAGRTK